MTAPIRLFHVSDVHFGVEHTDAMAWFADAVHAEKPDAVICTGDLTQRATHKQFDQARLFFESLKVPVTLEPGNHDMPYYNLWERFTQPYKRYGALADSVGAILSFDHCVIISLKTTVRIQPRFPWSDGYVHKDALAATLREVEALSGDGRFLIVSCHHPLLPAKPDEKNPTIGGDAAFAALADAGVDAILTGHVHVPFDLTRASGNRSVRMVGAGTLSTRLRGAEPGYNVVTYDPTEGLGVEQRVFGLES
ncbi:metallophosphoesterase family protein [Pontixanthobacter aquaemixtae]|uniref:Metallophosphoesterase n=1 Tax=Pontixanthobacter aquaemixtae TaxID=1958940 RepID=A0A844ZWX1_9SPHN|nr:metallophosphoesterase [Pontixanthobacter aquaemixtae]MXO91446.1 metallophosphoesterase [Pontixanthobacter aquaemixtae]